MDKLEGDALFVQPYLAYVDGGFTAVASASLTYTDYDDSTGNIDSGKRYSGSLSVAYAASEIAGATVSPFAYVAGGYEDFDLAGGDDDQSFVIGRAGLEVSHSLGIAGTGTLHVFAAIGPEFVSSSTATSAGPLTLTDHDDDRFGGYAQLGFEFTVAGTDARMFASATGSGLFSDAPDISGQVGLTLPF